MRVCDVKCVDTGETMKNNVAYKAPTGRYWSSEEAYLKAEEAKQQDDQYRYDAYYTLVDILPGYDREIRNALPTNYSKISKKLGEQYGFDIWYETVLYCIPNIEDAISRLTFESEWSKMQYILAIIRNNINTIYNRKKLIQKENNSTDANTDIKSEDDIRIKNQKQTARDISMFLEDDDE